MKLYDEPIEVVMASDNWPMRVCWRGQWHDVAKIQDCWKVRGHHWYKEETRWYYQLLTKDEIIMEVCLSDLDDAWTLVRTIG